MEAKEDVVAGGWKILCRMILSLTINLRVASQVSNHRRSSTGIVISRESEGS